MAKPLAPRSVALVGVSADDRGFGINGRTVLNHLVRHGYTGRIVPIHPRASEIAGYATASSLKDLSEPVDCALIAVAAGDVLEQVKECAERGIQGVVVLSSQFAESGPAGAQRQEELAAFARDHAIALSGPNTTGFVRTADRLALSATSSLQNRTIIPGSIAIVTQSGALGGALFDRACEASVGLSYRIGTENEAVLEAADYVDYLLDDRDTKVIALYLEGLRHPQRFLQVADRAATAGTPLVVFTVGRTAAGAHAALSHTGGIVGEYDTVVAAMRHHGVVVVDSLDDLVSTANTFASVPVPRGRAVGIYTFSGALGVALTDRLSEKGLDIPDFGPDTAVAFTTAMGPLAVPHNPFDVVPQSVYEGSNFHDSLLALAEDAAVDVVVVTLMPVAAGRVDLVIESILAVRRVIEKPILVFWYCGETAPGLDILRGANVPVFVSIETCVAAAHHLANRQSAYRKVVDRPRSEDRERCARQLLEGRHGPMSEWDSLQILRLYGLPLTEARLVTTPEEASDAAMTLGLPAVLKVVAPSVTHKATAGGVRGGLLSAVDVGAAFTEVTAAVARSEPGVQINGALVQPYVSADVEMLLGLRTDLDVGSVIVIGQGGLLAGHLGKSALAFCPLDRADAEAVIKRSELAQALAERAEGWERIRNTLVDAVLSLSDLASEVGDLVSQVEMNPLRISLSGRVLAVDCLVVCRDEVGQPTR